MTSSTSPTRRALLGTVGAGWLLAASGCDLTTSDTSSGAEDVVTSDTDVDETLLASVRATTRATAELVSTTLDQHPALAGSLLALSELHTIHLEAIAGEAEAPPLPDTADDVAPVPPDAPDAALRLVTDHEELLLAALTQGAHEAESGRFARLLASMAAGLTQQLARSADAA